MTTRTQTTTSTPAKKQSVQGNKKQKTSKIVDRKPAQLAMAGRGRVHFGEAYMRDLRNGKQRDFEKQICHAVALGLGSVAKMAKLTPEKLREDILVAIDGGHSVSSAEYVLHKQEHAINHH